MSHNNLGTAVTKVRHTAGRVEVAQAEPDHRIGRAFCAVVVKAYAAGLPRVPSDLLVVVTLRRVCQVRSRGAVRLCGRRGFVWVRWQGRVLGRVRLWRWVSGFGRQP